MPSRRVLCLLIFGLLTCTWALAQDAPEELLKNPGFDLDADGNGMPDDWSTSPQTAKWQEVTYLSRNYELASRPGTYVVATQNVTLKRGQKYTLRMRLRGVDGASGGALIMHGPERPSIEQSIVWNLEPAATYEEYVATFTAPNPACRLYIYNVSRQGMIFYDSVSLREGEPKEVLIQQLHFPAIDRPAEPLETQDYISWANPVAGGALKTLCVTRALQSSREWSELDLRLQMDSDLLVTGYEGEMLVSPTGRQAMRRLQEGFYEVYVVNARMGEGLRAEIARRVSAGAGLVILEGFGIASKFLKPQDLTEVPAEHWLRSGYPENRMPEILRPSVQTGKLGQGRVVRLSFPVGANRLWGCLAADTSRAAWWSREFAEWEWSFCQLSRAITWAARGEPATRLSLESATGQALQVRVEGASAGSKLRVTLRSSREVRFDGPWRREPAQELPVGADGRVSVPVPAGLPEGPVIADVTLLDAGGLAVNWGSFWVDRPQATTLAEVTTDRAAYAPGEPVKVTAKLQTPAATGTELVARVIDAFGRVVSEARLQVDGRDSVSLDLPGWSPLGVHHAVWVQAMTGGREQDSHWIPLRIPAMGPELAAEDFTITCWGQGMLHPFVQERLSQRLRDLGFNSEFAQSPDLVAGHGLLSAGYIGGMGLFRENGSTSDLRRTCLNDPKVLADCRDQARKPATDQRDLGMFAVGIGDELLLSDQHSRQEVCFCPLCQAKFQEWLRARYGSLEALNRQWDTSFTDWSQIKGTKTEEIRGKANFGPFVDFRTFMTETWISALKTAVDGYHEGNPSMPIGQTNTFGVTPFNGNDFWRLATQVGYGWGQEYSEAIKASGHKAIFDLWRGFIETPQAQAARKAPGETQARPFFNYGWIGYDRRALAARYEPWWLALHGSRGISYFAAIAVDAPRGTSWSLVYPDLSYTGYSQAVRESIADLRAGCGKLLIEYQREQPKVAVLWSFPSMLVSWCQSKTTEPDPSEADGCDSYGSFFRSAFFFRQHLNELQLDYQYVTPEQITGSEVLRQFPMLILPFTVAANGDLVSKLESYVEAGGVLVGDLNCLRTDEHGKPYPDSALLRRLFGVERGTGGIDYGKTTVTGEAAGSGLNLQGLTLQLFGRETLTAAGAKVLAHHATGEPAVLLQAHGKGLAVYLNFGMPAYDVGVREILRQVTAAAGIPREVTVDAVPEGNPPRCYELATFRRGPLTVYGLIRDFRRCQDSDPVRVRFGEASHLYDLRAGKYLGEVKETQATLDPGSCVLYACLPYRVTALRLTAPAQVRPGDELRVTAALETSQGTAGDHVLHLELVDPAGVTHFEYQRNLLAPSGKLDATWPLARNDSPGVWTVKARDVLTGTTQTARFEVTRGDSG
ncbi:MAG: beta-galactosidase [Armatimonadia bacterium]